MKSVFGWSSILTEVLVLHLLSGRTRHRFRLRAHGRRSQPLGDLCLCLGRMRRGCIRCLCSGRGLARDQVLLQANCHPLQRRQ